MPTYVYRREDGSTFEIQQRITEDALEQCPETGQKVQRIISGNAGLIFKGSGFYLTDYARSNGGSNGKEQGASTAAAGTESKGTGSTESSSTTKPETKAA